MTSIDEATTPPQPAGEAATPPDAPLPADRGRVLTDQARRLVTIAAVAVAIAAPLAFGAVRWPQYWYWVAREDSPMTWLESVVLVVASLSSLLTLHLSRMRRSTGTGARTPVLGWGLLALGFGWLAFDEYFAVHERVRDSILAPRDVRLPLLTWVAPGDFLLILVAAAGLVMLPFVWRCFRGDRRAIVHLLVGIVLAVAAVGIDSIDPSTWTVGQERIQQSLEEVVELASGLSLLAAVACRLLSHTARLAGVDPAIAADEVRASPAPTDPPPAPGG